MNTAIESEKCRYFCLKPILSVPAIILTGIFMSLAFGVFCSVEAQQTRDQCYSCCGASGLDEYFAEQCRLKCFRNPDHCISGNTKESVPAARPAQQSEKPQRQRPVEQPTVAAQEQPARPQPRRAEFVWPNPLNLVPGREFEAAGQILVMNGIPPQHPNHAVALRAVQDVLVSFGINNPTGGALPTGQLERIVGQFR